MNKKAIIWGRVLALILGLIALLFFLYLILKTSGAGFDLFGNLKNIGP